MVTVVPLGASGASFLVFAPGDEVVATLTAFARKNSIQGAVFSGIGVFSDVDLGYLERERNDYKHIVIDESVEVLALEGNISVNDGRPEVHAHVTIGMSDGSARGGHLFAAHVYPTLEMRITPLALPLRRQFDPATQQALITR